MKDNKGKPPLIKPKNRQNKSGPIDREIPLNNNYHEQIEDFNQDENSESHEESDSSAGVSNYINISNKNSHEGNSSSDSSDDEDQIHKIIKGKIQYDAAQVILEESKSHLEASVTEQSSINELKVGNRK